MKDLEKSNSKELTTTEKSSLFAELTAAEAEVTKGGMFRSRGHRRSMPRSYLRMALFFLNSLFGFNNPAPRESDSDINIIVVGGDFNVANGSTISDSNFNLDIA